MIPYNNSIIVPVDTGYGNIKIHCIHSPRESQHTRPSLHLRARYFISEKCITALEKVTRSSFPTEPLTKNFAF